MVCGIHMVVMWWWWWWWHGGLFRIQRQRRDGGEGMVNGGQEGWGRVSYPIQSNPMQSTPQAKMASKAKTSWEALPPRLFLPLLPKRIMSKRSYRQTAASIPPQRVLRHNRCANLLSSPTRPAAPATSTPRAPLIIEVGTHAPMPLHSSTHQRRARARIRAHV